MQNNVAELQVHVAGSSIAMLQGQRPPFRLLVRATGIRDGRRVEYVKPAVSDAFVVSILSSRHSPHWQYSYAASGELLQLFVESECGCLDITGNTHM